MRVEISAYWAQKLGNSPEEYEDAFWYEVNPRRCVVAVSDGATEASFSREWANILVHGFVEQVPECWTNKVGKRNHGFISWLRPLQKQWYAGVDFSKLPWFALDKAQKGAFASLLGLAINLEKGFWQALAVGDTNLFVVREGQLVLSWPLRKAEQFGSSPYLVGSNPERNTALTRALRTVGGRILGGETFVLATDAIAAWFTKWRLVPDVNSQQSFKEFVDELRSGKELKNDDTTLVVVKVEEV